MKVVLVPSSVSADGHQQLTSFLINDVIAVDAGSAGFYRTAQEQAAIKHVLISHTHMDHVASLPILLENAFEGKPECIVLHGSAEVLECIHKDLFNDRIWPDFIKMSENSKAPFVKLSPIAPEVPFTLEGLRITPVMVDHVVPTMGFVIEEPQSSVIIVSDTGPTDRIYEIARQTPNLKAVYLEACFPNSMEWLAKVSKHLTPAMFKVEAQKIDPSARVLAVHIKSRYRDQVSRELHELGLPNVEIAIPGVSYRY